MKKTPKKTAAVSEETWEKLHAAFVDIHKVPMWEVDDAPTLKDLCKRFGVPFKEADHKCFMEDWNLERDALRGRAFVEDDAPGAESENEYVIRRATRALEEIRAAGICGHVMGGEGSLANVIASARVTWRIYMGPVLLWEAKRAAGWNSRSKSAAAPKRARTPHGRAERVA